MITEQELLRREQFEYQQVISSLQVLLSTKYGKTFIKHLFDNFGVGTSAPVGMTDRQLLEHVAYLRSGTSIYEICLKASPELTGQLIAEMQRDREKNETSINESSNGN